MNLAVIPARKGSKGLKDKNLQRIIGVPLWEKTLRQATLSQVFDKVIITTDSEKIIEDYQIYCGLGSIKNNIDLIKRPKELCEDDIPLAPVILHALNTCETRCWETYNTITTLQPTSPLRTYKHIQEAHKRFIDTKADSLLSVTEELHSMWKKENSIVKPVREININRQYLSPLYKGNGAIFITKRHILLEHKNRLGGKIELYVMDKKSSVDVHTQEDLELAKWYLKKEY